MGDGLYRMWKGMQRSSKDERSYRQGRHLRPTDIIEMLQQKREGH